jgi:hypothetical protein
LVLAGMRTGPGWTADQAPTTAADRQQLLVQYCGGCHNDTLNTAALSVLRLRADDVGADASTWEKILRRLSQGQMPPAGRPRPAPAEIESYTRWLETSLDKAAAKAKPDVEARVGDVELASRLAFFLWRASPDDALLAEARRNRLARPAVLRAQVERMLADPRARSLTDNFGAGWLDLARLQSRRPDAVAFPRFDEQLRASMRTETELFADAIFRQNRSVIDFLDSDDTYLDERLAKHYGVPGIQGPSFRRVTLPTSVQRSGLLGKAAILTATSYDTGTSAVRRGSWILDKIVGLPPASPPPDIPTRLKPDDGRAAHQLHVANSACRACHARMDPLGLALHNFDAVGAWRESDADGPIDALVALPDGLMVAGPDGLQSVLVARKEAFVDAFTERLMAYALGRPVAPEERPTVRAIRRQAAEDGYRMNAVLLGIIQSQPFAARATPEQ